jgi:hypothetical protein
VRLLVIAPNQSRKWNWGHQHLRDEFGRHCEVVYYGAGYPDRGEKDISKVLDKLGPFDAILSWDQTYCGYYDSIKDLPIVKVVFLVDYVPSVGKADKVDEFVRKHEFDLAFLRSSYCLELFCKRQKQGRLPKKTHPVLLHFGVDTSIYTDQQLTRDFDVAAIFSMVSWAYPRRAALSHMVKWLGVNVITGGQDSRSRIVHEKYVEVINRSKIFVSSNGTYKAVLMKYFEAMACGALLVTDKPTDSELLGFVDGENIVFYRNIKEAEVKMKYYLANPKELERVAKNGYSLVHKYHGNDKRVKTVMELIGGLSAYTY